MKTTYCLLTVALGFTTHAALAQLRPPPQPLPDAPSQSCCGASSSPYGLMPPSPPASTPGSDTSGGSRSTSPESSGNPGSSGTPPSSVPADSSSGSNTPGSMPDSSGASGMQSEAGAELRPAAPPIERLQPQTHNDVTYLCGGIGKDEVSYMKQQASGYDLMLTFAAHDGSYLADVNVDIKDSKGDSVLQTNCDAPIMLVDLPKSGTYRIHADAAGYSRDSTATVRNKAGKAGHIASVVMSWPQQVAKAPATPATSTGSSGASGKSDGTR